MLFKLIGRTTVFKVTKRVNYLDFIPCVHGVTLDGKFQTVARIEDVEIVPDTFIQ